MTAAAPPMSEIMFSMFAPGFSEMPPVSKVTPLPTSATFGAAPPSAAAVFPAFPSPDLPAQVMRTRRGPRADPPPTAVRPPKPPAASASSSSTSTSTPADSPSFAAASANTSGYRCDDAVLTKSRAVATASMTAAARAASSSVAPRTVRVRVPLASSSSFAWSPSESAPFFFRPS